MGSDVDVMEALASLLEKSLVRQVDLPRGEPRLVMLETIREYATERLDERESGPLVRRAHATYYADRASRLRRELGGTGRDQAMLAMAADVGNFHLAWRYWIAESDLGQLTKLADSLLILNEARGWYLDTVELTTNLLAVLAEATSTPELVGQEIGLRMSLARALLATRGFTPEVADAYARALELFEGGQELRQHYSVLRGLASLYLLRTEFDKAGELGERILALARREGDPSMQIDGHLVVGSTLVFTGDLQGGLRHLDSGIGLFESSPARAVGSRLGNDPRVSCLTTSAFALWLLGYPDGALERANASLELARRLDHPYTTAYAQFHSSLLHLWRGEPETVIDRAELLLELADEYDFRIWSAIGSCLLGTAQASLGQAESGLARIREGMASYQGLVSPPVFWPMLLYLDGTASGRAGLPARGLGPIEEAIALVGPETSAAFLPEMLLLKGDLLAALEATGEAVPSGSRSMYELALEKASRIGARMSELRAATRLCRSAADDSAVTRQRDLQAILGTFTEGFGTSDLVEARALASVDGSGSDGG